MNGGVWPSAVRAVQSSEKLIFPSNAEIKPDKKEQEG